jgi:hypothetical protein
MKVASTTGPIQGNESRVFLFFLVAFQDTGLGFLKKTADLTWLSHVQGPIWSSMVKDMSGKLEAKDCENPDSFLERNADTMASAGTKC